MSSIRTKLKCRLDLTGVLLHDACADQRKNVPIWSMICSRNAPQGGEVGREVWFTFGESFNEVFPVLSSRMSDTNSAIESFMSCLSSIKFAGIGTLEIRTV